MDCLPTMHHLLCYMYIHVYSGVGLKYCARMLSALTSADFQSWMYGRDDAIATSVPIRHLGA